MVTRFCHDCGTRTEVIVDAPPGLCELCGSSAFDVSTRPSDVIDAEIIETNSRDDNNTGGMRIDQNLIAPIIRAYEYGDIAEEVFLDSLSGVLNLTGYPDAFVIAYMHDQSFKPVCKAYLERMPIYPNRCSESCFCVICSSAIAENEIVAQLPCMHAYHESCIRSWFSSNNTCPTCRSTLYTDDASYFTSVGDSKAAMRAEVRALEVRDEVLTEAVKTVKALIPKKKNQTITAPPQNHVHAPFFLSQPLTGRRRSRPIQPNLRDPDFKLTMLRNIR